MLSVQYNLKNHPFEVVLQKIAEHCPTDKYSISSPPQGLYFNLYISTGCMLLIDATPVTSDCSRDKT
jgi:hypothetical protein